MPSIVTYPDALRNTTPSWVKAGSVFHLRLRRSEEAEVDLTSPIVGSVLLAAARFYHDLGRWHCRLIVIMPDHLHALLSFPIEARMSQTVGEWKRFTSTRLGFAWQPGFFDHRVRDNESLDLKSAHIRNNPVVRNLCRDPNDWPWRWSP